MNQRIFSQEIRFKDETGKEFPRWERKILSDIGSTYTGLSGKTKNDFGIGDAAFITYMNVFSNLQAQSCSLEKVDLSDGKKQNPVIKGDLLFTTSSETPQEVGMVSYWGFDKGDVYLNSFCFGFRLNTPSVNPLFLAYLLRSEEYRAKITLLAQGSTRYNLSKSGLLKINIDVPSIPEQEKIITFLSLLDGKIKKEKEKLEVLVVQKKGFMQQMFI